MGWGSPQHEPYKGDAGLGRLRITAPDSTPDPTAAAPFTLALTEGQASKDSQGAQGSWCSVVQIEGGSSL